VRALRFTAIGLSVFFHPLLVLTYGLLLLAFANPFLFGQSSLRGSTAVLLVKCFSYTFVLPLLTTLLMSLLGMVKSLSMPSKEERIGPLIAALVFYTWFLMNMLDNPNIPKEFDVFVLGVCIALGLAFFANVFIKVSLHAVGLGGLTVMVLLMGWKYGIDYVYLGGFGIHMLVILAVILLMAGLVTSVRIFIGVHRRIEIYSGFLIGTISLFIAMRYLL
jgi:hypothetical protein